MDQTQPCKSNKTWISEYLHHKSKCKPHTISSGIQLHSYTRLSGKGQEHNHCSNQWRNCNEAAKTFIQEVEPYKLSYLLNQSSTQNQKKKYRKLSILSQNQSFIAKLSKAYCCQLATAKYPEAHHYSNQQRKAEYLALCQKWAFK